MNEFLVELYVAKGDAAAIAMGWDRFTRAAAAVTREGRPVRLVRSIFVPEDETCFLLVEAQAAEVVRETARRAALVCERVVEAAIDLSRNGHRKRTPQAKEKQ